MAVDGEWLKGQSIGGIRHVLMADEFYISYNPNTKMLGSFLAGEDDGRETALVEIGPPTRYYILNGDFREDYTRLVPEGLAACKRFFAEQVSAKSSWSDDLPRQTNEGDEK